ncbi:MAG: response regulator [Mucilaginibacter sp.]|nr:response regulator [Mucilaginibacter sp.]
MKLLLIEDEQGLRDNITNYFNEESDICESCGCLNTAIEKLSAYEYDCILLDIGLPDGEGFVVLDYLREKNRNEAVVIISARNSLDDKIKGLNIGADDYLTKPFHLAELKARVVATYRRKTFNTNNKLIFNEIAINLLGRTVEVNQTRVVLTRKEYDMLLYFIANKGKVISKTAIAEHMWGDEMDMYDNFDFIYTHIKNLRKKLLDANCKDYLKSIYGIGYKFMTE